MKKTIEIDFLKLKEVVTKIIDTEGSIKYQLGDLLTDIGGMIDSNELKNISVFNTATETEEWKIEQRISAAIGQKILLVITPEMWIKENDINGI